MVFINRISRIAKYFFLITIGLLIVLYWQWFRVAPLQSDDYDGTYTFGIMLLLFYGLFTIPAISKDKPRLQPPLICIVILLYLANSLYVAYHTLFALSFVLGIGLIVFVLYALFTFPAIITRNEPKRGYGHAFSVIAILLFLANGVYLGNNMPEVITSVDCNGATYLVAYHPPFADWDYYTITVWKGWFDYKASFLGYNMSNYSSKLTCDKNTNEVRLFTGSSAGLAQSFGSENHTYDWQAEASFRNIDYGLYSYSVDDIQHYLVTACGPGSPDSCEYIPVDQSVVPPRQYEYIDQSGNLIADPQTGDIYVLIDGKICADLQNKSRKIKTIATRDVNFHTPAGSTNPVNYYGLAAYQTGQAFDYMLYSCDDKSGECEYIPFSYTTPGQENAFLEVSSTNQLSVYLGGRKIFTYTPPAEH